MVDMLSPHFSVDEFTATQHRNVDNTVPVDVLPNLKQVAQALEIIRTTLDKPLIITSGYRCLKLNRMIGSKDSSAHVQGLAADFICPQYGDVKKVFQAIKGSKLVYDQLILEKAGNREWIHIAVKPAGVKPRMQALLMTDGNYTVA